MEKDREKGDKKKDRDRVKRSWKKRHDGNSDDSAERTKLAPAKRFVARGATPRDGNRHRMR